MNDLCSIFTWLNARDKDREDRKISDLRDVYDLFILALCGVQCIFVHR